MTDLTRVLAGLAKARTAFKALKKSGKNPHLKNQYSTLADMLEACGDALTKNGLQIIQTGAMREGRHGLCTTLYADDGSSIESFMALDNKAGDAQAYGSWITYCRRYALAAMLGLEGDWDDDGEAAVGRGPAPKAEKPEPPKADPEALKVIAAFAALKVTEEMLSAFLGHPAREAHDFEVAGLREIYKDMKAGKTWQQAIDNDPTGMSK